MAKWRMSDEEFERQYAEATKRGEEAMETEPHAVSVRYDRRRKRVVIELVDGSTFMFPPELAQGLADAPPADIADIRIMGYGQALAWDKLDVHFSVTGLLSGRFGNDAWMKSLKSRRRAAANATNRAALHANGQRETTPKRAADKKLSQMRKTGS